MQSLAIYLLTVQTILLASIPSHAAEPVAKPIKVFILAGQSNMQGHAQVQTFDAMRLNPVTKPLLAEMRNADGTPRVCDQVWISSIGSSDEEQVGRLTVGFGAQAGGPKIGPEFSFGIWMDKLLDEPIVIIKTAWGGKSLNTDFRPPSAGPYEFTQTQLNRFRTQNKNIDQIQADKAQATGHAYRLMIDHVRDVLSDLSRVYPDYDPQHGYELAGFVWFQGWNDMVDSDTYPDRDSPGGYDRYSHLLELLIQDVRTDLSAPDLPFVIGVMGVGGPTEAYGPDQLRYRAIHQNFRDAMAAPASRPEFQKNVAIVLTEKFWDMQVTQLRERERTIKPKLDDLAKGMQTGSVTREQGQSGIDKLYSETFNETELEILQKSVSNAEYHYLGSAGILAQIGKAFAETMVKLLPSMLMSDGSLVTDDATTLRVFIFEGQSNMVGSDSHVEDIRRFPPFVGLEAPRVAYH